MPKRRAVLQGGIAAAGLALAGCTDAMDRGGDTAGETDWHYDAGARFGASTVGTATVDFGAVREAQLPEEFREALDSLDQDVESVDLADVESIEATGFLDHGDEFYGGSIVVLGEFDTEALGDELAEEDGIEPADTEGEWDRYESEYDDGGLAVREDAIVYGVADAREETDADPVAAAIAAGAGDAAPFTDRENGETLDAELSGDVTVAVDLGAEWREELGSGVGSRDGSLGNIVKSTQAFGLDVAFQGETTELSYVVVADPEELDAETVREFLEQAREAEGTSFDDVSVSRDGRAIVATTSVDTEALMSSHESVLFGRSRGPERTAPNVALGAEQTDDGRVRVTHQGGDSVDRLEVLYDGADGRRQETWTGDPIAAGDTYVTEAAVAAGGSVRIVWVSEDGSQSTTLFRAEF